MVEYEEGKFEDGRFCPIIERNTVIPASHTERLYTVRDNQDKVRVRVLQERAVSPEIICFWEN